MKKFSYIAFSALLLLFFTACAKQSSSQEPKPDSSSPADQSAPVSEAAPEESEAEYQTYEIPIFELEFDCPADFGGDVESHVFSEGGVAFSVGAEDRTVSFYCSRTPMSAKDLDVAAAIDRWKEYGFKTFELLDSFSTPDSYGFYYIGEDSFGDDLGTQLCYRYVNYGGFQDVDGVIDVELQIVVPESVGQEAFTAFCEALTNSLRLSDSEAPAGDSAPSESGNGKPALKALSGGTYDAQCKEIVNMFFEYASLVRYGAPSSDLLLLMDGNEDLFQALGEPGEILCSSHSFTSDLTFQNFEESGTSSGSYYINVIETRSYDQEELGTHEYMFTFRISINSPTDYCITGIDSEYVGAIDTSYHGPDYDESSGLDDLDGLDEFYTMEEYSKVALQRTFRANAQIPDELFDGTIALIEHGDDIWAICEAQGSDYEAATRMYDSALHILESYRYTDTPLYEAALRRRMWGP